MNAPLRIAHINTEKTWRGGEQQVTSLLKGLKLRGQENFAVVRKNSPLASKLKRLEILTKEVTPLGEWDLFSAQQVRRFLLQNNIHVVHAHSAHAVALAALSVRTTAIPLVMTRRVDFHLRQNFFSSWKYGRVSRFVAISEKVKDVLLMDGIPRYLIDIVPSGIDFDRYQSVQPIDRSAYGLDPSDVVIGQVAALADHKDQATLLKALALLREKYQRLHVVMLGEGKEKESLGRLCRSLKVESSVHFLGFKDNPLDFLAGFDLMCLSSKEEGLGTSILDAMALRIPVVATRAGGIPELIQNEETGYLADVGNPPDLARALDQALQDRSQNQELLEKAYKKAQSFDITNTVEGMIQVYESVINI